MTQLYLSKSDFKIARECQTKLYYHKLNYPTSKESNEYLQLLAEGGFVVGKMAQLQYPDGIEVKEKDLLKAVLQTQDLLRQDKVTLFEAAFLSAHKFVRVDILVKNGSNIDLIEVKAKSIEGEAGNTQFWNSRLGKIKADWQAYLEDITFQAMVLKKLFPENSINCFLLMPDKNKVCKSEGLAKYFKVTKTNLNNSVSVEFTGDLSIIENEDFLTKIEVNSEVDFLFDEVVRASDTFVKLLSPDLKRIQEPIGKKCKDCEYRIPVNIDLERISGFKECWGKGADVQPHILDLYFVGGIGRGEVVDELIAEQRFSLYDFPKELLTGSRGQRQEIQIEFTEQNKEWQDPNLENILSSLEFPLHFIDFETYQSAIPYHKGMRPYEKVAFQWSCHTLSSPDSEPIHNEYLNLESLFPNFEFAEQLMKTVGYEGTILVWSQYENSILRDIYLQMENYGSIFGYSNPLLKLWIERTAKLNKEQTTRLVDLNELCLKYYFHPEMKGKTSIKYVLPAIWNNNPSLHKISWLKKYFSTINGEVINPYKKLEEIEIAGKAESVREGTGAMRAYEEMVYGASSLNQETKNQWAGLLKEYCKLDTLAMLIIWLHWTKNTSF